VRPENLRRFFSFWLRTVNSIIRNPISETADSSVSGVILVVECLQGMINPAQKEAQQWIPKRLPSNVKMIITVSTPSYHSLQLRLYQDSDVLTTKLLPNTIHSLIQDSTDPLLQRFNDTVKDSASLYCYRIGAHLLGVRASAPHLAQALLSFHRRYMAGPVATVSEMIKLMVLSWEGVPELRQAVELLCATLRGLSLAQLRKIMPHKEEEVALVL
jgi:hypothetical protein